MVVTWWIVAFFCTVSNFAGGQVKLAKTCLPGKMSFSTLRGDKVSMLTRTYSHKPLKKAEG